MIYLRILNLTLKCLGFIMVVTAKMFNGLNAYTQRIKERVIDREREKLNGFTAKIEGKIEDAGILHQYDIMKLNEKKLTAEIDSSIRLNKINNLV